MDGMASGPAAAAANSLIENGNQINEQVVRVRDDGPLVTLTRRRTRKGFAPRRCMALAA
jgi:hypothetical protein